MSYWIQLAEYLGFDIESESETSTWSKLVRSALHGQRTSQSLFLNSSDVRGAHVHCTEKRDSLASLSLGIQEGKFHVRLVFVISANGLSKYSLFNLCVLTVILAGLPNDMALVSLELGPQFFGVQNC